MPEVRQVEPMFKDNLGLCGCGCELEGVYRVKAHRDGTRCIRTCSCNRCRGKRSRQKGDRKAAQARRALNLQGANTTTSSPAALRHWTRTRSTSASSARSAWFD